MIQVDGHRGVTDRRERAGSPSARGEVTAGPETHTADGAPTDQAHREVGDGTLVGAVPAGLSLEEFWKIADQDRSVESGTG
jgi:hypothetical protein